MKKTARQFVKDLVSKSLIAIVILQNFAFTVPVARAEITDGMNATNVIGTNDSDITSSLVPFFTKGAYPNSNDGPNRIGVSSPRGAVIDTVNHRLFVADEGNNRVLEYDLNTSNVMTNYVADRVLGQTSFNVTTAATTQSGLSGPSALAYDQANEYLFVADAGNNRVLVFDTATVTNGENAINVLGQSLFSTSGSAVSQTGMSTVRGLAYDPTGQRLFVDNEFAHRVLVFNLSGGITDGMAASNVLGQTLFTTGGSGLSSTAMNQPIGLAFDDAGDRLFVADDGNARVLVFNVTAITNGEAAVNVLGQTTFGTNTTAVSQIGMSNPIGVGYDDVNFLLYVADIGPNRVTIYDVGSITDGEAAVNVLNQATFTSSGTNPASAADIGTAQSFLFDSGNERMYIVDFGYHRVLVFDAGAISDYASAIDVVGQTDANAYPTESPYFDKGIQNNGPNRVGLSQPFGVAVDEVRHQLFVSDSVNARVLVYELTDANLLIDRVPDHVLGQADFNEPSYTVDASTIATPYQLVVDQAGGRLFVAEGNNRIMVFDITSITDGEAAINVLGQSTFFTNGSDVSQTGLDCPTGLAYDQTGQLLYVVDECNHRVMVFDAASITDGEPAVNVLGQLFFNTNGSGLSQTEMYYPWQAAYDDVNDFLFLTDEGNIRVLVFDVSGGITDGMPASHVIGQPNFGSNTSVTSQDGVSDPNGIAYDATHSRLFVGDYSDSRMTVYNLADGITDGMPASNVIGQSTFTATGVNLTQSGLSRPNSAIYVPSTDTLYIADTSNNRIMLFDVGEPATETTFNSVTLSRIKVNAVATGRISFYLPETLSTTLTATFPSSFTMLSAPQDADSSGCLTNFDYDDTLKTVSADKTSCGPGIITLGGFTVQNPPTTGSYIVTWVNDFPGSGAVAIVDDDQINVNAQVSPSITFDLNANNDNSADSAPYSVPLGALSVASVTHSDGSSIPSIWANLDTNATSGAVVTVLSASAALASASAPGDTIPNSETSMAAGTANYGLCVSTTNPPDAANGTFQPASPYDTGTCDQAGDTNDVKALSTVAPTTILDSASAPVTAGVAEILVNAAIDETTVSHTDYVDTLTFVAAGTF